MFLPGAVIFLTLYVLTVRANCYFENGTDVNTYLDPPVYVPCDTSPSDLVSMCYSLDNNADKCNPNGLISNAGLNDNNTYWRESCTDQTWTSPVCLKICLDGTGSTSDQVVTHCPSDDSYCCGGMDWTACCQSAHRFWIDKTNGESTTVNPSATSSTITSTPTSTSTTSPTTSPTADIGYGNDSNSGSIIGGSVGGILVLAVIAGLFWFYFRKRRRGASTMQKAPMYNGGAGYGIVAKSDEAADYTPMKNQSSVGRVELDTAHNAELDAGNQVQRRAHEMDTTEYGPRELGNFE